MEVILLEKVNKLGDLGAVVRVKDGFARNFLLPFKKALRATGDNKKVFAERRAALEVENNAKRAAAETQALAFSDVILTLLRQASEDGKLFGSVAGRDIALALQEQGFAVTPNMVQIFKPVRAVGISMAKLILHPEVTKEIAINVARTEAEAEKVKKAYLEKGVAAAAAAEVSVTDQISAIVEEVIIEEEPATDAGE